MDSSPFRDRRFAPHDVRRILRRAAEISEHDADTQAAERALTLGEIERLGGELGLPAAAIREAARDDATPTAPTPDEAPDQRRIVLEDEIEGELPAAHDEDIVDAITNVFGDSGRTQFVGRTMTWSPTPVMNGQQRQITITVRVRDGRTRIRIDERLRQLYLALFVGIGMGLGFGGGVGLGLPLALALKAPALGLVVFLAFALLGWVLPHLIFGAIRRNRIDTLGRLQAHLRAEVRRGIASERERATTRARIATGDDADAHAEAEAESEAQSAVQRARR
ncbi:MAG: hypothetical protein QM820_31725 [Minicystis sp.]